MLALFIFNSLQQNSAKTVDKTGLNSLETCCLQLLFLEITGTTTLFPPWLICLSAFLERLWRVVHTSLPVITNVIESWNH